MGSSMREFGELIRSRSSSFRRKSGQSSPKSPRSRRASNSSSNNSTTSTRPTSPEVKFIANSLINNEDGFIRPHVPPLGMFLLVPAVHHARGQSVNNSYDPLKLLNCVKLTH